MSYSRLAVLWVMSLFVACACSCEAFPVINGTTNVILYVHSPMGEALVQPGISLEWFAASGEAVSYGTNGVSAGSFTVADGHDYTVYCGSLGPVVVDSSVSHTKWFWMGFTFTVLFGLYMTSGRWVGKAIIGGGYNE